MEREKGEREKQRERERERERKKSREWERERDRQRERERGKVGERSSELVRKTILSVKVVWFVSVEENYLFMFSDYLSNERSTKKVRKFVEL